MLYATMQSTAPVKKRMPNQDDDLITLFILSFTPFSSWIWARINLWCFQVLAKTIELNLFALSAAERFALPASGLAWT
jgi:hypothetical protein